MRIAHVIDSLSEYGGAARRLIAESAALRGIAEVHFICLVEHGDAAPRDRVCLLRRRRFDPRILIDLTRYFKTNRIDLVATHFMRAGVWGRIAAASAGIPAVVFEHGLARNERFPYRLIDRLLTHITTLVVANSNATAEYAKKALGLPQSRIRVVYPFVDFRPLARRRAAVGPIVIGNVAGLNRCKGHDTLLRALALLVAAGRNVRLEIVGDGPLRGALERLAGTLGIRERVTFWGYRKDVDRFLAGLDVFAFPSQSEGFGIAVVEAMLAGVPVVCSDAGGLPEIVSHERSGLIAPAGNADALAAAIGRLLDDGALATRLAETAARIARSRFQTGAAELVAVLAQAVKR